MPLPEPEDTAPLRHIVTLPAGLVGLPYLTEFALIEHQLSVPVRLLQSLSLPDFVFVLIDPFSLCPDYQVELCQEDAIELQTKAGADLLVLAIMCIPEDVRLATANLLAPLVVNMPAGRGKQLVLRDRRWPINYPAPGISPVL